MKILLIVAVVGLLVLAGFVVASAIDVDDPIEEQTFSCEGGCSADNTCGNPSCGFEKTGSCGCGKR